MHFNNINTAGQVHVGTTMQNKIYYAVVHAEFFDFDSNEREKENGLYDLIGANKKFNFEKVHTAKEDITTTWVGTLRGDDEMTTEEYALLSTGIRDFFVDLARDKFKKEEDPKVVVSITTFYPEIYPLDDIELMDDRDGELIDSIAGIDDDFFMFKP